MILASEARQIALKHEQNSLYMLWCSIEVLIEQNAKAGLYSRLVGIAPDLEEAFLSHPKHKTLICSGYKLTKLRQNAGEVVYEISWE